MFINFDPNDGFSVNARKHPGAIYCNGSEMSREIDNGNACCCEASERYQLRKGHKIKVFEWMRKNL